MLMYEVLYHVGNVAHGGVVGDVCHQEVFHATAFFHDWGYHQPEEPCEHGTYDNETAEDAEDAELHVAAVLEELDQREQQVGDEPR